MVKIGKGSLIALFVVFVLVGSLPGVASGQTSKKTRFYFVDGTYDYTPGLIVSAGNSGNTFEVDGWYDWNLQTTDPRVSGRWLIHGLKLLLKTPPAHSTFGPGRGTWTLDTNFDGIPEWEGVVHIAIVQDNFISIYNGRGLGIYSGFTVHMGDHDGIFDGEIIDPKASS